MNFKRILTIEDIAEFHWRFEKIYPFQDGNGRIGRMIVLKQCIKNNLDLFYVNSDSREEYINCLSMYHRTKSHLYLSEYFKKQQAIFISIYAKYLYELNKNETLIVDYISVHKYINRVEAEKILKLKSSGTGLILRNMVKKGLIKKIGDSRSSEYILNV
jgi:Fic family protein